MQFYSVWPGAYSFKSEIKALLSAFKEYVETVLKKIEDAERETAR